jgi:recombinational DNA repair protein RecR
MDDIIKAYTKCCTDCGEISKLWTKLRDFARRNGKKLMVVRTPLDPNTYAEANAYGVPQPFYVLDGVAHPLSDISSVDNFTGPKRKNRVKNTALKPEDLETADVKREDTIGTDLSEAEAE